MKGSLQVKSNKYYAVFRIDGKTKWHSLGIEAKRGNKRKAEFAMTELITKYCENPNLFNKIQFANYIKEWLVCVKKQVDIITYEGYRQYAERHIIPYFEEKNIMLQDVRIQDVESYYNYKSITGRLDGKEGGLSPRTIKLHAIVLNLVFKRAICEGLIERNPCDYAKIPKSRSTKSVANFYTAEECKQLLKIVENTPLYDMIYITVIYGLRRSELMGLKWDAIDFENDTVTVKHTVVLNSNIVEKKDTTKNKTSMRTYPLLPDVKEILIRIKTDQEKNKKLFGNCYVKTDYVFTREDGSCYYPSYPTEMLTKYLKKNKMPHIRWHDLRHSCASILIVKGWHMKDISEWLGHSDIGTTMNIYGHISIAHKREISCTLRGLLE